MENTVLGQRINQSLHEIYLGRFGIKVFLLEASDGSLILVDTGLPDSGQKIIKYINSIGKSVTDIKYILITHTHIDHIGSAAELKKMSNAMLGVNEKGIKFMDGTAGIQFPQTKNIKDIKTKLMLMVMKVLAPVMKPKFVKPDMVLKEGVFPQQMHLNAKIVETPGHTPDSVSIYLPDSKTIIVGDTLFGKGDKLVLPQIYDDYISLLSSVKKIRDLNPDLICVSHGKNHHFSDIDV